MTLSQTFVVGVVKQHHQVADMSTEGQYVVTMVIGKKLKMNASFN